MLDKSIKPHSSTKALSTAHATKSVVSGQYHESVSGTGQGTTKGFFDDPSNVASTLGAVLALAQASVIVCVLVLQLTDEVRIAKR